MGILFYSSDVAVSQTVGEIQALLTRRGVTRISTLFNEDGEAVGLGFTLTTDYGIRHYEMPVRVDGIAAALLADASLPKKHRTRQQALRTAWRIVKSLLEAQMALLEAEMATIDELMLPFMVDSSGRTMYEVGRKHWLELES